MGIFKSRGLRGSVLEESINYTIEIYRNKKLALIQKIPTPITPIEIDNKTRHIKLAYFDKKSTVDYIGVVQGVPICFDAKESKIDRFPLANVHSHQIEFMNEFKSQEGIAFFLIHFSTRDEYYYMSIDEFLTFKNRELNGGRKSFLYTELNRDNFIKKEGIIIHFLINIQKELL